MKYIISKCLGIILILFISILNSYTQELNTAALSKVEIKVLKLEEKVKKAQDKIDKTLVKLAVADSLIQVGKQIEAEAKAEKIAISIDEKNFLKQQNAQLKDLNKRRKKASEEELKQINAELKALDLEYKNKVREIEKRIGAEYKRLEKGLYNIQKGIDKQKQYKPILKDYKDALKLAEDNLEKYKTDHGIP